MAQNHDKKSSLNALWNKFTATGSVADYLAYSALRGENYDDSGRNSPERAYSRGT